MAGLGGLLDDALNDTYRQGRMSLAFHDRPNLRLGPGDFRLQGNLRQVQFGAGQRAYRGDAVNIPHRVYATIRRPVANPGGGLRGNRYFRIGVSARAGMTSSEVMDLLRRELYSKDDDYGDPDDMNDPDVLAIQANPLYEFRDEEFDNFDAVDHDDLVQIFDPYELPRARRGFFDFKPKSYELRFAIRKLTVRDVPCIFESLFIILCEERDIDSERKLIRREHWIETVLVAFSRETTEFQDMCYQGLIEECIRHFTATHGIEVGLYDCYLPRDKAWSDTTRYLLAYQFEHVFPMRVEDADLLAKAIEDFMKKIDITGKCFAVYPSYLYTAYLEYTLWKNLGCPKEPHEVEVSPGKVSVYEWNAVRAIQQGKIPLSQILACQENHKQLTLEDGQAAVRGMLEIYQGKTEDELIAMHSVDFGRADAKVTAKQYMATWEKHQFIEDHKGADVKRVVQRRSAQFDRIGLIGVDIETCEDNRPQEESGTIYNQRPYILSVYGRLQKVISSKEGPRTILVPNIKETFIGMGIEDCIDMFIDWLVKNNYTWTTQDLETFAGVTENRSNTRQPKVFNYVIAHNGFNFDYRFFYEKLLKIGSEFRMIGDIRQTKSVQGCGLLLYDFANIYKERLADLARTFFPQRPDLHKLENENVVALPYTKAQEWIDDHNQGNVNVELQRMIEYNMRDARVVFELGNQFFKWTFTTPFGHSFLPDMFYHSLSSLAWSMWNNCFFKDIMFVNSHTLAIEQSMKIGGLTQTYRRKTGCGIIIDVNSFYPSIMKNLMPLHYKTYGPQTVEPFLGDVHIDDLPTINPVSMYRIKYQFPKDCKLPTIVEKTGDTLVLVLQSAHWQDDILSDKGEGSIWVYGETIKVAMECGKARVRIFQRIEMQGGYVHKDFIEYCYSKRLEAKAAGDAIQDKFYKNMMNMCFGKHGQKQYEHTVFGSWTHLSDTFHYLQRMKSVKTIQVCKSLSNFVPMYELKFSRAGDAYNHKGATVRISSFIMEMARTHLMRMKYAIAEEIGWESISYCDTDSIVIAFDIKDRNLDNRVSNCYMRCKDLIGRKDLTPREEAVLAEAAKSSYDLLRNSQVYKKIEALRIKDVTTIHLEDKLPLLDDLRLGACKVEKFLLNGLFTGQKQYAMVYTDGKTVKQSVKAKGVPASMRAYDLINDIAYDDDCEKIVPVIVNTFCKMGAGVTIYDKLMMIRATLSKRRHDMNLNLSFPFTDIYEQRKYQQEYNQNMEIKRMAFIQTNGELLARYKEDNERYQAFKEGIKFRNADNKDFKLAVDQMTAIRKELMIKIPKYKYGFIQDMIINEFVSLAALRDQFTTYVPKLYSIANKAVWKRRVAKKKGVNAFNGLDYYGDMESYTLTDDQSAKVIAFCLYANYVAQRIQSTQRDGFHRTGLFVKMCKALSNIVMAYMNQEEDKETTMQWQTSIVCGFQFLLCPIQIKGIEGRDGAETPITSLWRFFSNLLAHAQVNPEYEVSELLYGDLKRAYLNDEKKIDFLFETIRPVARDRKQNSAINNLSEEMIDTGAMSRYAMAYIRPEPRKDLEIDKDARRQARAMEILIAGNVVDAANVDPQYYQKFYEMVSNIDTVKMKLTSDADNYMKAFYERQKKAVHVASRKDVADFCLIFFVFYHFGIRARDLVNAMMEQYRQFTGSCRRGTTTLIEMFRVLFMRSDMLGGMKVDNDRLPDKIQKPINKLLELVDRSADDAEVKANIETIVSDVQYFTKDTMEMVNALIHSPQESQLFNQTEQYITRALMWMCPSSDQMKELFTIAKVNELIPIQSRDFEEVKVAIFDGHEEDVDKYLKTKREEAAARGEDLYPGIFTPPRNLFDCDDLSGFIVPDQQYTPMDFNIAEHDFDLEEMQRHGRRLKRMAPEEYMEEEEHSFMMRQDKRQSKNLKRMRRFLDLEAVEGTESEQSADFMM